MASSLRIAALVVLALPIVSAQARDAREKPTNPRERATAEAARKFSVRMGRLDALMGGVPRSPGTIRARSANAEN